jgi:hypothetical protein
MLKIPAEYDRDTSSAKSKDYFSPTPCFGTRCICRNQISAAVKKTEEEQTQVKL